MAFPFFLPWHPFPLNPWTFFLLALFPLSRINPSRISHGADFGTILGASGMVSSGSASARGEQLEGGRAVGENGRSWWSMRVFVWFKILYINWLIKKGIVYLFWFSSKYHTVLLFCRRLLRLHWLFLHDDLLQLCFLSGSHFLLQLLQKFLLIRNYLQIHLYILH